MYREAIITFVDVLGFKKIIQDSSAEEVSKILKKMRYFSAFDESEDGEGALPKVIQFSDSIIRVRLLDSKSNIEFRYGALFHELNDLVLMQGGLINNGICVRGGVTIGEIYFDNNSIYGPGFVKAYELESMFANYPRIVIDPLLIAKLKKDKRLLSCHNNLSDELDYIDNQIRIGSDGLYYIDYLGAYPRNMDDQEYIPSFFESNKRLILSNLKEIHDLNSVTSKYLWLANYHNEVVDEYFERTPDTKDLWITNKDTSMLSRIKA